jgi:hypothetical protein
MPADADAGLGAECSCEPILERAVVREAASARDGDHERRAASRSPGRHQATARELAVGGELERVAPALAPITAARDAPKQPPAALGRK